jgi:hypothetical protein
LDWRSRRRLSPRRRCRGARLVDEGSTIEGTFSLDADARDLEPEPGFAVYQDAVTEVTVRFSEEVANLNVHSDLVIVVDNERFCTGKNNPELCAADRLHVNTLGASVFFRGHLRSGGFFLSVVEEQGGELLESDALPLLAPPLGEADLKSVVIKLGGHNLGGELTSLFLIPEPTTVLLLAIGGLASAAAVTRGGRRSRK